MISQFASGLITLMMAKLILNDMPHAMFGNPTSSSMTSEIIARAGLKEHEEIWFPPPGEGKPKRAYPYRRVKNIGVYSVTMTRTNGSCMIRLFEFLEGWRQKLRATWTGYEKPECDRKFEEVCEAVKQVRAEHIYEMRKALEG